jgi:hypothetical protein
MNDRIEKAKCRGCGRELKGKPYHLGGSAFIPETGEPCPINQYGGFVCSRRCDVRACLELESSMPGAGRGQSLSTFAEQQIERNWGHLERAEK